MCTPDIKDFIFHLYKETTKIVNNDLIGFYLHGSAAMGGFNPNSSDIDLLAVTNNPMAVRTKRELAQVFLKYSTSPFPVEISFLNTGQLKVWQHPCPFDFHYSEFWRGRYESDLVNGTAHFLNGNILTDADLAAHITILHHRGVCLKGRQITEVFPLVPRSNYLSSIVGDFEDCLGRIEENPIYCILNLIRVFWYVKEGMISSKREAGEWGILTFPEEMQHTIKKALQCYTDKKDLYRFKKEELSLLKYYILENVQQLLNVTKENKK